MRELHGVVAAALGHAAQGGGVGEHLGQGHLGGDHLGTGPVLHVLDAATAAVQVADDITHVVLGDHDLDGHDGLEDHGGGLLAASLEAHGAGDLERHLVGVHIVVATVVDGDLDVDAGVARQNAGLHGFLDALIRGLDVFLGHHAALDVVDELVALARLVGLDDEANVAVLAATTRLAHELAFALHPLPDGFAVGHHGLAHVGFDLELSHHAVDDDLQVELTHAGDDGLIGLGVGLDLEGGVFLGQAAQSDAHLLLVGLGLGLDGHLDHGIREVHGLQDHRLVLIADGLPGEDVLEAHGGTDVARADFVDVLALVGVHLQQATNALAAALGRVVDAGTRGQNTGVDAQEGEGAHKGIGHDLEDQGAEGLAVLGFALDIVAVGILAGDGSDVEGRRHVADDGIQHGLDTLVLEGAATHHRREHEVDAALADAGPDLDLSQLFAAQVLVHQDLVRLGNHLDKLLAPLVGGGQELLGDVAVENLEALVGLIEGEGLHDHEINDALEVLFGTDGDLDGHGPSLQAGAHHLHHAEEVSTGAVHLVHEGHAGHAVLVGLAPHGLGLGLDAAHGAEDGASAVQYAQGALHLGREVHVAGGVDDVDAVLDALQLAGLGSPGRRDGSRGDGDAPLLLLDHPVGGGGTFVHLTDLVDLPGVVEDALRGGGLAGIDMRHDADVPVALEGGVTGHCGLLGGIGDSTSSSTTLKMGRLWRPIFRASYYHRKWANALLASAILWTSSFFFTAAPRKFMASRISPASLSRMVRSPREAE